MLRVQRAAEKWSSNGGAGAQTTAAFADICAPEFFGANCPSAVVPIRRNECCSSRANQSDGGSQCFARCLTPVPGGSNRNNAAPPDRVHTYPSDITIVISVGG